MENKQKSRKEKQIDALKNLKANKEKQVKAIEDKSDDIFSTQEKISDKLSDERMDGITKLSKDIEFNNLTHYLKILNLAAINSIGFRGPLNIYEDIKYQYQ